MAPIGFGIIACILAAHTVLAEKVMFYSEKQGIMWVEKSQLAEIQRQDSLPSAKVKEVPAMAPGSASAPVQAKEPLPPAQSKDPDVFYKTGQRYFFDGDYAEALRYFDNAYQLDRKPEYYLFIAKCHRKLGEPRRMLFVLDAIMQLYPQSEVADDALFEMALYYEMSHNYQGAVDKFKQLAEQYPYGTSITTKQEFRDVAREQMEIMKNELNNLLTMAGLADGPITTRIKDWQEMNGVPATGLWDQKTVMSLINVRLEREKAEAKIAAQKIEMARLRRIGSAGLAVFVLIWIWCFGVGKAIKSRMAHMDTMLRTVEIL